MARVLILLSVILFSVYMTEQAYFLQNNFIQRINEGASTWKAGVNFDPSTPLEHLVKRLGSKGLQVPYKEKLLMYKSHDSALYRSFRKIPKYFDARKKWRQCKTISKVLDQGNCGSCWAVATSSAFSDRLCIATDGEFNQLLSTEELTFCCHLCGFKCWGGSPIMAWMYFWRHGIVTGGEYNTTGGCAPYRVHPCPLNKDGNSSVCSNEPMEFYHSCPRECYGNKDIDFKLDHKYTRDFYYLTYAGIQKDIMAHGPIEATIEVYDDFFNYKSGVYIKSENATLLGGHAVKLIGWGEENGVPYWLCMNSWNEQWGDKGLFKIRRGTNECGIDNSTTAGVPVI